MFVISVVVARVFVLAVFVLPTILAIVIVGVQADRIGTLVLITTVISCIPQADPQVVGVVAAVTAVVR